MPQEKMSEPSGKNIFSKKVIGKNVRGMSINSAYSVKISLTYKHLVKKWQC